MLVVPFSALIITSIKCVIYFSNQFNVMLMCLFSSNNPNAPRFAQKINIKQSAFEKEIIFWSQQTSLPNIFYKNLNLKFLRERRIFIFILTAKLTFCSLVCCELLIKYFMRRIIIVLLSSIRRMTDK